jgi:hypothetical protein
MFSIRNIMLSGIALLGVVGCQVKNPGQPVTLIENTRPMTIDGAMQIRDADPANVPVTAVYENSDVQANADRFPLQASDSTVDTWGWASETPIFLANSVIFPFTYFVHPPGQWVIHQSDNTLKTNTAVPPMDPIAPYGAPGGRRGSAVNTGGASASAR